MIRVINMCYKFRKWTKAFFVWFLFTRKSHSKISSSMKTPFKCYYLFFASCISSNLDCIFNSFCTTIYKKSFSFLFNWVSFVNFFTQLNSIFMRCKSKTRMRVIIQLLFYSLNNSWIQMSSI